MSEEFLCFLWQYRYFKGHDLRTISGLPLQIIDTGQRNYNAGPDFSGASLVIEGMEWHGDIEIHIRSSGWNQHGHQGDPHYRKVILHVVWESDTPVLYEDASQIPCLELKPRTSDSLLSRYKMILQSKQPLVCGAQLPQIGQLPKKDMMDKALIRRLQTKSQAIKEIYNQTSQDWEETTYRLLAKNFGFKTNAEAFLSLAESLPLKILRKHQDQGLQIEALLFGQAGFLEEALIDPYFQQLKKEYAFLKAKYSLQPISIASWKFLRMRPANFPTLRLAQFAQMIVANANLFSVLLYADQFKTLQKIFKVGVSTYWQTHYHFEKATEKTASTLGKNSLDNIIINTVVPLLAFYSDLYKKPEYRQRAIAFLESIAPEKNHITEIWEQQGLTINSALDSQALIEQYNNFCTTKKCLECSIGIEILKQKAKC